MRTRLHLIALACSLATGAHAQTAAPEPAPARIEVTGTMIKRADSETPAPVTVISREDIERAGATTIDELLRMDPSSGVGGLDDLGTGNGFAAGTASISLRGMGSAATLVLINGRRITPASVVDVNSGKSTIFNVNSIPMSAIERIEILKSGASSLYGSDALAGVVNIILRNDYTGRLIEVNARQRADGLFKQHTVSGTLGFGDLEQDGFNVLVGAELHKRDAVTVGEKPDLVRQDLYGPLYNRLAASSSSAWPGNLYTYNNGSSGSFRGMLSEACPTTGPVSSTVSTLRCLWDSSRYLPYTGEQERGALFLRGAFKLGTDTTVSAELMASQTRNTYTDSPGSRTESLSTWGDGAGNTVQFMGLALPADHPDNPTRLASADSPVQLANSSGGFTSYTRPTVLGLRYRFADIPEVDRTRAKNARLVLGLTTVLGDWDVESGFLHHEQKNSKTLNGRFSMSGLNQALTDGSYRFGGVNSAAVRAQISPAITDGGKSTTTSLDARGSRSIGKLDGGLAMLGVGAEVRHESFEVNPDPLMVAGDIIGRGISEANGSRNVAAAYAELQLPLIKGLETQTALRAENYSDFGSAITAKVGAKYKLSSALSVRGSWANGFRAPSLSQVTKSSVFAFSSGLRDPKLCPTVSSSNVHCSLSLSTVSTSNPDLKPEKSDSYTLGVLFEPTRDTEVVVDGWYIERRGEVDRLSSQEMLNRQDEFPNGVLRLPGTVPGELGQVYQVRRSYMNLAQSSTSGIDLELSQRVRMGEWGDLRLKFGGTHLLSRKEQVEAGQPTYETVGYYEVPRNRYKVSASWTIGAWSTTLSYNVQSAFQSFDAGDSCDQTLIDANRADLCRIKSWKTADLSVGYKGFKGMRINLSVRNLADSRPPFDPNEADETGVSSAVANALGRYFSLSLSYEF